MFNAKQRRMAAPVQQQPQAANAGTGSSVNSGFIDLQAVLQELHGIIKNPAGKKVKVDSSTDTESGVHTFTIKVQPTPMMQKAEQNGAVPKEPAPAEAEAAAPAQAQQPEPAVASANKYVRTASVKSSALKDYPVDFLKTIGL